MQERIAAARSRLPKDEYLYLMRPIRFLESRRLTAMQLFEISTWLECLPTGKEGIQIRSLYVKLSTKQKPYRTFMRILY